MNAHVSLMRGDPDHADGWYFSDEGYELHGPFCSQAEAIHLLVRYCDLFL